MPTLGWKFQQGSLRDSGSGRGFPTKPRKGCDLQRYRCSAASYSKVTTRIRIRTPSGTGIVEMRVTDLSTKALINGMNRTPSRDHQTRRGGCWTLAKERGVGVYTLLRELVAA